MAEKKFSKTLYDIYSAFIPLQAEITLHVLLHKYIVSTVDITLFRNAVPKTPLWPLKRH
jgi:hypothetical protein